MDERAIKVNFINLEFNFICCFIICYLHFKRIVSFSFVSKYFLKYDLNGFFVVHHVNRS